MSRSVLKIKINSCQMIDVGRLETRILPCPATLSQLVVVVGVFFILSRLLYLAFSANLGLLCMPHPGMGPLV